MNPDSASQCRRVLPLFVGTRIALDVLWWLPAFAPGINLLRVGTVALLVALAATLTRARGWRWPELVALGLLALGLARSTHHIVDLAEALRLASPVLLFAVAREARIGEHFDALERTLVAGFAATGLLSLVAAAAWPDAWVWLHETWRLRGVYHNIHNLSLVMAMGASMALYRVSRGDRLALIAVVITVPTLYATYTRSSWIFFAVSLLGLIGMKTARRLLGVGAVGAALLIATDPAARARFGALLAPLGSSDSEAWLELGTGRIRMWTTSLAAFVEQGPVDWVLGSGIRGAQTFWKPKNPANEFLNLTYQFGALGLGLALATLVAASRRLAASSGPYGAQARAALLACVLVAAVTDSTMSRITPSWVFAIWLAIAFTASPASGDARPPAPPAPAR
ncbi:MAG: hypothetical protein EP330_05805 [Deltaproteobacteria bacterium]|nr:MAG: hypothetical protein EP330_05805 [Deltaproteobacteria bacterium]